MTIPQPMATVNGEVDADSMRKYKVIMAAARAKQSLHKPVLTEERKKFVAFMSAEEASFCAAVTTIMQKGSIARSLVSPEEAAELSAKVKAGEIGLMEAIGSHQQINPLDITGASNQHIDGDIGTLPEESLLEGDIAMDEVKDQEVSLDSTVKQFKPLEPRPQQEALQQAKETVESRKSTLNDVVNDAVDQVEGLRTAVNSAKSTGRIVEARMIPGNKLRTYVALTRADHDSTIATVNELTKSDDPTQAEQLLAEQTVKNFSLYPNYGAYERADFNKLPAGEIETYYNMIMESSGYTEYSAPVTL